MDDRRRVLVVAYDDAQILDIACPAGAMDIANRYGATPPYDVGLGTLGRRAARSSVGITLGAGRGLEAVTGRLDTLIVVGGVGSERAAADERLVAQVRRLAARSRRIASAVCTGSLILAAAGLLDGREATTYWASADYLGTEFDVTYRAERYVRSGKIITAAGVSAGIDMALYLVSLMAGETTARAIQLAAEYDPRPPFDSGNAAHATPELRAMALRLLAESQV